MKDGEEVLDILARDPHTAHHISYELAQHFVTDNPPDALVDRMTQAYEKSDGDIRAVLHAMIYSPEFWSKDVYRAKIKTPFELVTSVTARSGRGGRSPVDAGAMDEQDWRAAVSMHAAHGLFGEGRCMGEYRRAAGSGMNFSLALTANRIRGVQVDVPKLLGNQAEMDPGVQALDRAIAILLAGQATPQTRATLEKQLTIRRFCARALTIPSEAGE